LAVLAIASVSQADLVNLVADPSFGSGGVSSPWTGISRWYTGATLPWMPNDGETWSDSTWAAQLMTTEGPIRQTLTATYKSGYSYDFSFWACRDGTAATRTMRLGYMDGASFIEVEKAQSGALLYRSWVETSGSAGPISGGAVGKAIVVSLEYGSGDYGEPAWVDDVIVTEVPEPATIGLLALGGLAVLRRRRK
jgi:hypothetical protein